MHGAEGHVGANKHKPEVELAQTLVKKASGDLGPPVVDASEEAKNGSGEQHVMEVGNNIVSVRLLVVRWGRGVAHAAQAADGEQSNEPHGKEQGCLQVDGPTPQGCYPIEYLDARWHGDEHGRDSKHRVCHRAQPYREHVVGPDAKSHEADSYAGEDHERVPKEGLARKGGQHLGHDAHGGQDQDVHLGVPEQPEQVLPEHRVASFIGVEKVGAERAVK